MDAVKINSRSTASAGDDPPKATWGQSDHHADHKTIFLTELQEISAKGWAYLGIKQFAFCKGGLPDGQPGSVRIVPIVLAGVTSPHGIFTHPKEPTGSLIEYDISKQKKSKFRATVGVADHMKHNPSSPLTFQVWGDNRRIWRSEPVTKFGVPQRCTVDVEGVELLQLIVTCRGNANFGYAVWCEPRLSNN